MSPRAAWRLERLGFEAYDYAAGKEDWTASGLPTHGELAGFPRAGDIATPVPTCGLDAPSSEVRGLLESSDAGMCIVTNDRGVVLGRLRNGFEGSDDDPAEETMENGPTTVRLNEFLPALIERLEEADVDDIIVTTPLGELHGVLYRADGEKMIQRLGDEHHHHHV